MKRRTNDPMATRRSRIAPYLYLAPFLLGVAVFTLYPTINVMLLAFKENYSRLSHTFSQWGFSNFQYVLNDGNFIQALGNTFTYVLWVVPLSTCLAVLLAHWLNQKLRGSSLFQTAFFLPMVTSVTAVGLVWRVMFHKRFGVINYLLELIGIAPIGWLVDVRYNMAALVVFGIWNILPFTIILLLSGLQNIDEQYYIAARVDGAKAPRIFFRITVPLLSPTICLCVMINTISTFKVFSELYPLFKGQPGVAYNLYTVVYYIRSMMTEGQRDYGYAAAAAVVLFLFIALCTAIERLIQKKWQSRTTRLEE